VFPKILSTLTIAVATVAHAEQTPPDKSAESISRQVQELFAHCSRAVVKIHAADQHGDLAGTGFFVDPTGTLYTAYSVAAGATDFTVEFSGKKYAAKLVLADVRSGIALLKVDLVTPFVSPGKSEDLAVATPVVAIGFPLDLPETPSFGLVAGFDRKYLGRYFSTTHLRANVPTQRGEAGAPLLNLKGEVVAIVVSSLENNSSCYALPIEAAEKIRDDFVRYGEARHGRVGINTEPASEEIAGSSAKVSDVMDGTPAAKSGIQPGDILLQVGRKQVHQPEDVIDASFFISAGENVPITVMRGDKQMTFSVEAGNPSLIPHRGLALELQNDAPQRTP